MAVASFELLHLLFAGADTGTLAKGFVVPVKGTDFNRNNKRNVAKFSP